MLNLSETMELVAVRRHFHHGSGKHTAIATFTTASKRVQNTEGGDLPRVMIQLVLQTPEEFQWLENVHLAQMTLQAGLPTNTAAVAGKLIAGKPVLQP